MNTWNLSVRLLVDRPVSEDHARQLGQAIKEHLQEPAVVSTRDSNPALGMSATLATDKPVQLLGELRDRLANSLATLGYSINGLASFEVLSPDETDRRLASASIPPMVNTEQFAELCGVSRQRISELETIRRAAAADGQPPTGFPTPVVPGWWLKSAAERYATTRRRKPGPAPRTR
ncbi:hypothetical protein ALI144C_44895 [Actinosynnema sp. ALI-1.44]|uniref:hypothetical protein n=1 Tax=Actinosynnema sp. ALI-1.44 TaxID=1933779 RepID=UPI00097C1755|nr:hypothetical protein [Actinosynnema sp. ALI-1.44]ONI73091.1 hypothetical protein ALI144C_44895 [Actinosynnema sp. ALI-1.44]